MLKNEIKKINDDIKKIQDLYLELTSDLKKEKKLKKNISNLNSAGANK